MRFRVRLPRSPSEPGHGLHSQVPLKARKYIEVLKRACSGFDMTLEGANVLCDQRHPRHRMCASRSSGNSSAAKGLRGQSPSDVARSLLRHQSDGLWGRCGLCCKCRNRGPKTRV
jgi:hypothetical protein